MNTAGEESFTESSGGMGKSSMTVLAMEQFLDLVPSLLCVPPSVSDTRDRRSAGDHFLFEY